MIRFGKTIVSSIEVYYIFIHFRHVYISTMFVGFFFLIVSIFMLYGSTKVSPNIPLTVEHPNTIKYLRVAWTFLGIFPYALLHLPLFVAQIVLL